MKKVSRRILQQAVNCLRDGGIIAYPTEAVYGLGCDPLSIEAVTALLIIKQRPISKGFILIASEWEQVDSLVAPMAPPLLAHVKATWPGPSTWLMPASEHVPKWIQGSSKKVAIRISNHPVVRALCDCYGGPIISTSANKRGELPARDEKTVAATLGHFVKMIVPGEVGGQRNPTEIRDALTGEIVRSS